MEAKACLKSVTKLAYFCRRCRTPTSALTVVEVPAHSGLGSFTVGSKAHLEILSPREETGRWKQSLVPRAHFHNNDELKCVALLEASRVVGLGNLGL